MALPAYSFTSTWRSSNSMSNFHNEDWYDARREWLDQHGGRRLEDIMLDENHREFVMIWGEGDCIKKYLPDNLQKNNDSAGND